MADNIHIREALERLAVCRRARKAAAFELAEQRAAFEQEHAGAIDTLKGLADAEDEADKQLREVCAAHYMTTGEKNPCPGASVVLKASFEIDEIAGLAWAKQAGMCLKPEALDVPAVKAIAKVQVLPFVKRTDVVEVRVAQDIDAALVDAPL